MSFVIELCVTGAAADTEETQAWFGQALETWRRLPALTALDVYTPSAGQPQDPYLNDGSGPAFMPYLHFATEAALRDALAAPAFHESLKARPAGTDVTLAAFARSFYGPQGLVPDQPMTAPFSYVVRYHRPAEDETAFVRHYIDAHPPILATFPAIRAVLCYVPLGHTTEPDGITSADYVIGNEVVFDDIDAFNAAMASPVRHELRRDFHKFPPIAGRNTHFAMERKRVFTSA